MGVTLYLLDAHRHVRRILPFGVSALIHKEEAHTLTAEIPQDAGAQPGEYLGLMCQDGCFRLFVIDNAESDAQMSVDVLQATDEAVAELSDTVTPPMEMEKKNAAQAAAAVIAGTGWRIGSHPSGGKTLDLQEEAAYTWELLEKIEACCDVRILPRFEIRDNEIADRIIDIEEKKPVFRGRFFEGETDAGSITITKTGRPRTAAYGYGAVTGTDKAQCVDITGVSWSRAAGDPADKPAGQAWIGDAQAIARNGKRFMIFRDEGETDAAALLKKTWDALQERVRPEPGGMAALSDLESTHPHKKVRLYDQVAVKAKSGGVFNSTVIGISRDYIYPNRTKITIGKERGSAARSLTKRVGRIERENGVSRRSGAAGNNRIIHNEALIQLNAEAIQMNAKTILAQAEQIKLKASVEEVTELGTRLSAAEIDIDGANAEILLKASRTEVDAQGERIREAEIRLNGAESEIALKADKILLDGLVSYSEMKGEINTLKRGYADYIETAALSTQSLDANFIKTNTLQIGSQLGSWQSFDVVTGVSTVKRSAMTPDGHGTVNFYAVTNVSKGTIYYFGY